MVKIVKVVKVVNVVKMAKLVKMVKVVKLVKIGEIGENRWKKPVRWICMFKANVLSNMSFSTIKLHMKPWGPVC